MPKIVVYHTTFGCDTGCCGHAVSVDGDRKVFEFDWPNGKDSLEFAKELVADALGEEHVKDLDWPNSFVVDQC